MYASGFKEPEPGLVSDISVFKSHVPQCGLRQITSPHSAYSIGSLLYSRDSTDV